jgi:prevent-host-death family protein
MVSVGIKELKAKLSSYIARVNRGGHVVVTEHGREVAIIIPVSKERRAVKSLIDSGKAHWSGGKPRGLRELKIRGKPLSRTIIEERL